ncbi:helix-turn-helix domain-containing protein [Streptomyces sp. NPDC127197]|uniref:helix-turn-helix domain-containing protein n=1 Tax=Streptomyces sp. NPDC127197 TaxID=3345388 RepID=UPI003624F810
MMSHTSTIEARNEEKGAPRRTPLQQDRQDTVCRMPGGLDIVVTDAPATDLPREKRPHPSPGPAGDGPRPARRPLRLTARAGGEYLFVGIRGGHGTPTPQEPVDVSLGPGDICFYDLHHPTTLDFPERFRTKVFLVSRESLGLEEPDVHRLMSTPVARTSRLGALLSPFLSDLADTAAASRPPVGEMLARNAVNLLATLAVEQLGGDGPGTPDAPSPLMTRIREYVELHLADPDLSPETIAGAHYISVRYLHKLFKDEGTTVGRWIQRRRLEECRRELMLHTRGHRTIAAIANRWGFLSAAHFSRVFRAAYGMSPSEWRDTAGRAARAGRR